AGVFAVVAVRQFNTHEHDQSVVQLRKQAKGLASHFAAQQEKNLGKPRDAESTTVVYSQGLQDAIGALIYYFPKGGLAFGTTPTNLPTLPKALRPEIDWDRMQRGELLTFEAQISGRPYTAVAAPAFFNAPGAEEGQQKRFAVGALVLARPRTELNASWLA